MRTPNFFIVGAPKCGTTALDRYLGQHPEIFMCPQKETHHFAIDLKMRSRRHADRTAYLSLFQGASDEKVVGESSVWYLSSNAAVEELHRFEPKARILALIRNPVDWIDSYHSQALFTGDEQIHDLFQALEAQSERRQGRRLPPGIDSAERLLYDELISFSTQIERYLSRFGRDQVLIFTFDEFKRHTAGVFSRILDFLEVDLAFRPTFENVNPNKVARSAYLSRLLFHPPVRFPPALSRALARLRLRRLLELIIRLNSRYEPRAPLAAMTRATLTRRYEPEIRRLEQLLDRDLSDWIVSPVG